MMERQDDRTDEQRQTHTVLVVGTDRFLSGWGKAKNGTSYAAWACQPEHAETVERWVRARGDQQRVRVMYDDYRPRGAGHLHIYIVGPKHAALAKPAKETRIYKGTIQIHGRRWFQPTYGNTYHTCDIWVNEEHVHKVPYQYGYGSQYEQSATEWLEQNGYLPGLKQNPHGGTEPLRMWCERNEFKLINEVTDVKRKRDL